MTYGKRPKFVWNSDRCGVTSTVKCCHDAFRAHRLEAQTSVRAAVQRQDSPSVLCAFHLVAISLRMAVLTSLRAEKAGKVKPLALRGRARRARLNPPAERDSLWSGRELADFLRLRCIRWCQADRDRCDGAYTNRCCGSCLDGAFGPDYHRHKDRLAADYRSAICAAPELAPVSSGHPQA